MDLISLGLRLILSPEQLRLLMTIPVDGDGDVDGDV